MLSPRAQDPDLASLRCAYCHAPAREGTVACTLGCGTELHLDCWSLVTVCPTLGCEGRGARLAKGGRPVDRVQRAAGVVVGLTAAVLGLSVIPTWEDPAPPPLAAEARLLADRATSNPDGRTVLDDQGYPISPLREVTAWDLVRSWSQEARPRPSAKLVRSLQETARVIDVVDPDEVWYPRRFRAFVLALLGERRRALAEFQAVSRLRPSDPWSALWIAVLGGGEEHLERIAFETKADEGWVAALLRRHVPMLPCGSAASSQADSRQEMSQLSEPGQRCVALVFEGLAAERDGRFYQAALAYRAADAIDVRDARLWQDVWAHVRGEGGTTLEVALRLAVAAQEAQAREALPFLLGR